MHGETSWSGRPQRTAGPSRIDFDEKTSNTMKASNADFVTHGVSAKASRGKAAPSARRSTGREDDGMATEATRVLRAEMARRGINFKQLAEALAALEGHGSAESVQVLSNKINRGRFSFAFVLRAIKAMGIQLKLESPPQG